MGEYLDLYDINRKKLNKTVFRPKGEKALVPEGNYYVVIMLYVENTKGEYLIQKTSIEKGGIYATTGGHVKSGSTSLETLYEEVLEEIGYELDLSEVKLYKTYQRDSIFIDAYYLKKDIDLDKLVLQKEEVESINYFSKEQIKKLIENNALRKSNIDILNDLIGDLC